MTAEPKVAGKIAGQFVRESLNYQRRLAEVVAAIFKVKVYLFDSSGTFKAPTIHHYDNVRFVTSDGKYAVLSVAAQSVLPDCNTYLQYSNGSLLQDEVGVYLPCISADELAFLP